MRRQNEMSDGDGGYVGAVRFLYELQLFGSQFGLDKVRKLAALMGNPQAGLRFIHVAGTNGKGCTCAILESIYRHAGYKVGLYTSPHLISFCERIQVNRNLIPESTVARWVPLLKGALDTFPPGEKPTFFEVVTVLALCHFAEAKCDLVIWETGLGGRLDATNIVTPLASVITNIQLDHQQWLGSTIAEIAREKAGIIKPGVPVISGATDPQAVKVIAEVARENGSLLSTVAPDPTMPVEVGLHGTHQRWNAAVAIETCSVLQPVSPVNPSVIQKGLASVKWPGRFDRIVYNGREIILDGAHNPAGVSALVETWREQFGEGKATVICGFLADKDAEPMLRELGAISAFTYLTPVPSQRSLTVSELEALRLRTCSATGEVAKNSADALDTAMKRGGPILVAGSLYLIGEVLSRIGNEGLGTRNELSLNDWIVRPSQKG